METLALTFVFKYFRLILRLNSGLYHTSGDDRGVVEANRSEHEAESANRRIEMDQHLWRVWLSSLAIIHNKKSP